MLVKHSNVDLGKVYHALFTQNTRVGNHDVKLHPVRFQLLGDLPSIKGLYRRHGQTHFSSIGRRCRVDLHRSDGPLHCWEARRIAHSRDHIPALCRVDLGELETDAAAESEPTHRLVAGLPTIRTRDQNSRHDRAD